MTALQKRRWMIAVSVLVFALLLNFGPRMVYLNTSGSVPLGLYLAIPGMSLQRGDLVIYDPPDTSRALILARNYGDGSADHTFLKHVGALPGDIYGVVDDVLLVNGEKKGSVLRFDDDGNPMPVVEGFHMVRKGMFLPLGDSPHSLDGRYTGTVPMESIRVRVVPLIIEW